MENNVNNHTQKEKVDVVKHNKYKHLEDMDTAKLHALLQQESFLSDDDHFDIELVQQIVAILEEREPGFDDINEEASLKNFREEIVPEIKRANDVSDITINASFYKSNKSQKRPTIKKRTAVALIVAIIVTLLLSTVIAQAYWHELWQAVVSWGKEIFQIGTDIRAGGESGDSEISGSNDTIEAVSTKSYHNIGDALKDFNIPISTPDWIPDGFELNRVEVSLIQQRKSFIALYQADEKVLMFNVVIYSSNDAAYSYEIDEEDGETIIINGIKHYLMTNLEQARAVWVNGNLVYSLNGNVSREDLIKILNSIHEGEE